MQKSINTFKLKDGRNLGIAYSGDQQGKPLFFFHGWPISRLAASLTEKVAKKLGILVISIDRPGYGLSDFKPNRSLLDWPDDVLELADSLKIKKFSVIGVSGGGPYAAVCAYKIPDRIVKTGIVVGLAPTYLPGILEDMPMLAKLGWANFSRFPLLAYLGSLFHQIEAKYFPSSFVFQYSAKADKAILPSIKQELAVNKKEAFKQGLKGAMIDLVLYTSNWGFNLKDINGEVFLWYGEADKNVPIIMGKYIHSQIPKSKLTVYPNEGHLVLRRHTEEILEALKG